MHSLETCAIVAAYLACIGITLEFSHRVYWQLSKRTLQMRVSPGPLTVLTASTASIPLAAAFVVTGTFAWLVNHVSIGTLGLAHDANTASSAAKGIAVAVGCVTLAFLIGVLTRHIQVHRCRWPHLNTSNLPVFAESLVAFLGGAVFEELIFRGYIYYVLLISHGPVAAVVVSSALFSLAHLVKHRDVPVLFTVNAFVFGLLAALCRHYTGSLWLPIGLHFGWNVVSGSILGLPYSGRRSENGMVSCEVKGPQWLTGGLHSLDAGLLGTIALLVAGIGLLAFVPLQ